MDNLVYNLQVFVEKIGEELCEFKSCVSDIWSCNNSFKINKTNLLLVYMDLLRGGLVYI